MRFLKVPAILFNFGLKPMEFMVYCGIKSFCNRKQYTVVKQGKVASRLGISRNSVGEAVKQLEGVGLIKVVYRKQKHGIHANYRAANGYYLPQLIGKWIQVNYNIFSYKLLPSRFAACVYLHSRKNHANKAFPSYAQIAGALNIDERTAEHAVKDLQDLDLLTKKHYIRVIGRFGHNNYTLLDVLLRVAGRIKKKVLQLFSTSRNTLLSLNIILSTYNAYKITHIHQKINIYFMNRHKFYRKI